MTHTSILILLAGAVCGSSALGQTTIDEMKTDGNVQGLYEVREAARVFVAAHNVRRQTNWTVLEPDLRALVPKCLEPLRAHWKGRSHKTLEPVVAVSCKKPTNAVGSGKPWSLDVPVLISGAPKRD